jgi:CSLREA domain-containing protein
VSTPEADSGGKAMIKVSTRNVLFLLFTSVIILAASDRVLSGIESTIFTVNSTDDIDDGTCNATHCSLREAINAANALTGTDTIAFNIPGVGPHTIQPTSGLPTITDPVIIDGYTQPGASPNTNPISLGSNAVLQIELDGTNAGGNGLHITAGNSTVQGLVINRFAQDSSSVAVWLETNGNNIIKGNFIGTDITGTALLGNFYGGVRIENVPSNIIGGTMPDARNIISCKVSWGNGRYGILINGSEATGNQVLGNLIGTDITGKIALGNAGQGVFIAGAPNNIIGGTMTEARNIISGNGGGVEISGLSASGNIVQGNYIGTDVAGTADLGNSGDGITISAPNNIVGGTVSGMRNVISGNTGAGIRIVGEEATGNLVQGNYIGVDATGSAVMGNSYYAGVIIEFSASNNIVGGTTTGAGNVISGNGSSGVFISHEAGPGSTGNMVQGNYIGTDVTGTADLGNDGWGIAIGGFLASGNTIECNIIAFNGKQYNCGGVFVLRGTNNAIRGNSIFSNVELGVDLNDDGVTYNDVGDSDVGANNLQNFPVLTSVSGETITGTTHWNSVTITGTLNSAPNITFTLEFFANRTCDSSGYGEGETSLGFSNVTTDNDGNASFAETFTSTIPVDSVFTATATDPDNNTSEFSRCIFPYHIHLPIVIKNSSTTR